MKGSFALLAPCFLLLPTAAQTPCGTPGVTVTVSPPTAAVGQLIQITLTNNSSDLIQLPTSCVFGSVYPGNTCTGTPVFTPICLQVITPVGVGESVTGIWAQTDDFGQQVLGGTYAINVSYWDSSFSTLSSCCVTVDISGTCTPANATMRNGTGVNPVNLSTLAPPRLGLSWWTTVNCTAHASGLAGLYVFQLPATGTPTAFGELLVAGSRYGRFLVAHSSQAMLIGVPVPPDTALCGLTATAQGMCTGAPGLQLTNALDLVLGI